MFLEINKKLHAPPKTDARGDGKLTIYFVRPNDFIISL